MNINRVPTVELVYGRNGACRWIISRAHALFWKFKKRKIVEIIVKSHVPRSRFMFPFHLICLLLNINFNDLLTTTFNVDA